jgi:hypothetical protein
MLIQTYSRISDWDLAQISLTKVLADVTSDSLDIGCSYRGISIVDNLVTREESQGVRVLGELLDGREDILQIDVVVRFCGAGAVERVLGGVDIKNEVDASISQCIHALLVTLVVIDGIDADGVQTQLLELGNITLASIWFRDRVLQLRRSTGLVVDTTNIETVITLEEGVSLDRDGGDGVAALNLLGHSYDS